MAETQAEEQGAIRPIERPPLLYVAVQESVRAYIEQNRLQPGDALPSEASLAERLGVSRASVREAIKGLESLGMVETRRGAGVFVKRFSLAPLLDHLTFGIGGSVRELQELLEIRRALEVALIGESVALIGEADIALLRAVLGKMHEKAGRGENFALEDREFHLLLFRCQENRMLTRLIDVFWQASSKLARLADLENPDPMATWRDHSAILAAVVAGDGARATERMQAHYAGIAALLRARSDT